MIICESEPETACSSRDDEVGVAATKRHKVAADSFLEQFCASVQAPGGQSNELNNYLADPVAPISFSEILSWWSVSSVKYPKLAAIARKY